MERKDMLRIAEDEKRRFEALKRACDQCVPDELIEWINAVIEMIKKEGTN